MAEDNSRINWGGLDLFTSRFKEWVLKLFRRANARMGHIEEELYKVKLSAKADYTLEKQADSNGNLLLTLVDNTTGESHGSVALSSDGRSNLVIWEEDGSGRPQSE